ncbi:hypothetical protein M8C21_017733, partial [Ambrosia artemisiifolia]
MPLVHNRCRCADEQIVKVQETLDEIPEWGMPHVVSLLMHDKLVDAGKPTDRVEITGIYRAMTLRVGQTQRTYKSLFEPSDVAEVMHSFADFANQVTDADMDSKKRKLNYIYTDADMDSIREE